MKKFSFEDFSPIFGGPGRFNNAETWIVYPGGSGVGNDGDRGTLLKFGDQLCGTLALIVFVIADEAARDVVMAE